MVRQFFFALAIAVMAMGFMTSDAARAGAQETNLVVMKNFAFSPKTLTVAAGTTVTWKNLDEESHTVVSDTGLFRSGGLDQNETFSFKFDKPGVYKYTCSIHPMMMAEIIVK